MHIKKNVMENILGTVLNLKDQTKDNYKARLDLVDMVDMGMGIRSELHYNEKVMISIPYRPLVFI